MTDRRFVQPNIVVSHFHLRPGDKVGDFGAGMGNFITTLSKAVGQEGRVYACEIQKNLAEAMAEKVRSEHLGNVEVIWGDLEDEGGSKIEDDTLDAAVFINTLFQMEEKATAIKEVYRTLRDGGKLFIIDWTESWGGIGPQPGQILSESDAKDYAETAGFTYERSFDAGDHHYGLAFRK